MSDTVILRNNTKRARRTLVLNLDRGVADEVVTRVRLQKTRDGGIGKRRERIFVPGSVRVAFGRDTEVPASYARSREVRAAAARGELVILEG